MSPDRVGKPAPLGHPYESVRRMAESLRNGTCSARELVNYYLDRIRQLNPRLNAFVHVDERGALRAADDSDARIRSGRALSRLDGIPVAVKDNLLVRDCPATWGSPLFAGYVPAHDELPVSKFRGSGAVLLGKTNVPEFAMRGFTGNALFGVTRNPWGVSLTPGGSSGGAVAAVAAGLAPLALATDGGGSTRRPAAYTNLVGLKPSNGRIRRGAGFPPLMFDCEVIGAIGRTVADVRLLFESIATPDRPNFLRTSGMPRPTILFVERIGDAPVDPEITRNCAVAAERFVTLGYRVMSGELPFSVEAPLSAWQTVTAVGFAKLAKQHPTFTQVASPDFVALAAAGARLSAMDYRDAVQCLLDFRTEAAIAMDGIGFILSPATAAQPWPADQPFPPTIDGKTVGPRGHAVFTAWVNACGHPAIAIPVGFDVNGMPVGAQLIGHYCRDDLLLEIAEEYETAFPWAHAWPEINASN